MKFNLNNPRTLATTALMTALVLGLTFIHLFPTPIGGYIHPGDIAINFAALAFGPWVGLIAGGLGTALADLLSGYTTFAPLTLISHGLQGFLVGWIYWKRPSTSTMILAVIAGSLALVLGYFIGESLFFGGPGYAITEVPWNLIQEAVGALGAVVYVAVSRAYPRLGRAQ
jgi:uncharacterized membrane protein